PGDAFGTQAHDSSTRGGASREGDLVDVAVSYEMLTDFAAGGYDADHAFGELCGFEGFGEHHRAHRPLRRRLQYDGASGRERGRDLHGRTRNGGVPGDDRPDQPNRHANETSRAFRRFSRLRE